MNPFHYRATIDRLARLAAKPNPSYVRVHAACALANELSPANPRRDLIRRMLEIANPVEQARPQAPQPLRPGLRLPFSPLWGEMSRSSLPRT